MTRKSQQKKQLSECFSEYIKYMIYLILLFQIETLNLPSFYESRFAKD